MKRFRLESVLRLRKHREELRKRELAAALAAERETKDEVLRLADIRRRNAEAFRDRQDRGPVDVRQVIELKQYIGLLDRELGFRLRDVARAEHRSEACRQTVAGAMTDRKAIETLKGRAADAERREASRRETAELDEAAGVGWRRRRHPEQAGART